VGINLNREDLVLVDEEQKKSQNSEKRYWRIWKEQNTEWVVFVPFKMGNCCQHKPNKHYENR